MTFKQAIEAIEKDFNLSGLLETGAPKASLWVDGRYLIDISSYGKEQLLLSSIIKSNVFISDYTEEDWRHCLRLSRALLKSASASLSLDSSTNSLVLCQYLDLIELDSLTLKQNLEEFLNNLEFWVKNLEKEESSFSSNTAPMFFIP